MGQLGNIADRCMLLVERMLGGILLRDYLVDLGLVLHRSLDRQLGGFVVEFIDLGVILGVPVNEHATDNHQAFGLILGDDAARHAIGDGLGNRLLGGPEHLHGLLGA